jgi:large subunit ribosomal protein L9
VKVAAGYARNYLLPQGLAIPLTAANKRRLEALRQRRAIREAHDLNSMNELAASLSKITLKITVKTGADGRMFGSVTSGTIADELKKQCDVALDKKKIHLDQPLRSLGEHEVDLHLHADVKPKLKVLIESSTPAEPVPPVAKPAEESRPPRDREGRPARAPRAGAGEKPAAKVAKPKAERKA